MLFIYCNSFHFTICRPLEFIACWLLCFSFISFRPFQLLTNQSKMTDFLGLTATKLINCFNTANFCQFYFNLRSQTWTVWQIIFISSKKLKKSKSNDKSIASFGNYSTNFIVKNSKYYSTNIAKISIFQMSVRFSILHYFCCYKIKFSDSF